MMLSWVPNKVSECSVLQLHGYLDHAKHLVANMFAEQQAANLTGTTGAQCFIELLQNVTTEEELHLDAPLTVSRSPESRPSSLQYPLQRPLIPLVAQLQPDMFRRPE